MTLLVTGGHGFVMSNLARAWLDHDPQASVVLLDRDTPDALAARFFAGCRERIQWIRADLLDRVSWQEEALRLGVDRIVHGAALTPHPYVDADGTEMDPERSHPERTIEVNLGGTLAVLDFARRVPSLRRLILVSTGSVYGDNGPGETPLPEDGFVAPGSLYGISKYAAELVARRYTALFDLPIVATRLASVYGPMDRVLPSRHVICAPNRATALALSGQPILLNAADGVGDWIHVADVASALIALLEAERPRHAVYNVASGQAETLATLATLTASLVPGSSWAIDPDHANLYGDPGRRRGQWGAYDITRLRDEFGWSPRPLAERLADYVAWRTTLEQEGQC